MGKNESCSSEGGVYECEAVFSDLTQLCSVATWAGNVVCLCSPSDINPHSRRYCPDHSDWEMFEPQHKPNVLELLRFDLKPKSWI